MLVLARIKLNSQNAPPIFNLITRHWIYKNPSPIPIRPFAVTENPTNAVVSHLLTERVTTDSGVDLNRKHPLDGLVARLVKLRSTRYELRVREIMSRKNFGEDPSTFNPIIKWLTSMNHVDGAWDVVEVMRQYGVEPDSRTYNYILRHYLRHDYSATTAADDLLLRMNEEGIWLEAKTYHELVVRACGTQNLEEASGYVRRMVDEGEPVLFKTHVHIIRQMLRHSGGFAEAMNYARTFCEKDEKRSAKIFGSLVKQLRRIGRNREATEVVKEMVSRGLPVGKKLTSLPSNIISVQGQLKRLFN